MKYAASKPLQTPQLQPRTITILGATGSIGKSTLKLVAQHPDRFHIAALTAYDNVEELAELAQKFHPQLVVIGKESKYLQLRELLAGSNIRIAAGEKALEEAAALPSDVVMAAIVGSAGLKPALAAIRRGATVALANKECLVCAGEMIIQTVKQHGATLIPVDSEHNAIFQVFDFARPETIETITLTASGGPFLNYSTEQMQAVTPAQALNHPNWDMGAKISIDSATMMNKALEIIEAYYLFPLKKEQIKVVIHPESIIHSMVTYVDGSTLAQMGMPDMTTPIASALAWPDRVSNDSPAPLDLAAVGSLTFEKPDITRFPALRLAYEVLEAGVVAPVVFNAANEVAVARFLKGDIGFADIIRIVETALNSYSANENMGKDESAAKDIDEIIQIDSEVREMARRI